MKTIQQGRPDKSFTYTLNILQDINIWLQLCFYHVPPFNESKFTEECSELAVTPETIHQWSSLIYNISLKTDQNNMGQQEMGLVARKPVFGGLRTTKAQTSLCIRRVWLAPLLFTYWKVAYLDLLRTNFSFLSSLCSWGVWFESRIIGNPKDKFCRDEAKIMVLMAYGQTPCWAIQQARGLIFGLS